MDPQRWFSLQTYDHVKKVTVADVLNLFMEIRYCISDSLSDLAWWISILMQYKLSCSGMCVELYCAGYLLYTVNHSLISSIMWLNSIVKIIPKYFNRQNFLQFLIVSPEANWATGSCAVSSIQMKMHKDWYFIVAKVCLIVLFFVCILTEVFFSEEIWCTVCLQWQKPLKMCYTENYISQDINFIDWTYIRWQFPAWLSDISSSYREQYIVSVCFIILACPMPPQHTCWNYSRSVSLQMRKTFHKMCTCSLLHTV